MYLSVALCTYNGELFLKKQLDSIIEQNLKIDEVVICDDNSNDMTSVILEDYQTRYPELFKVYYNKTSLGTIKNFEKAISLTKGDLIFLSDQDDIWKPFKTEIMVRFFIDNDDCKMIFSNGDLVDDYEVSMQSTLWEKWNFNSDLRDSWRNNNNAFNDLILNKNKITGATVCFHKSLKITCIPIQLPFGYWHDAWIGIHASAKNGLYFIEESLIKYRIHIGQQVGINKNLEKKIITNSNSDFIDKTVFFRNIKRMYPNKKYNVLPSISSKFKKIIISIFK